MTSAKRNGTQVTPQVKRPKCLTFLQSAETLEDNMPSRRPCTPCCLWGGCASNLFKAAKDTKDSRPWPCALAKGEQWQWGSGPKLAFKAHRRIGCTAPRHRGRNVWKQFHSAGMDSSNSSNARCPQDARRMEPEPCLAWQAYQGCTMCHVKLETSACHEILSDVLGRTSCPSPWSDKGLKPLVQHWKPWKLLTGHGNFAFYHPLLTYNTLHHVGSVLQTLKAFLSCSKVEGLTSPLSAAIPWSSEQMCKFSARFDGCNRIWAAFWHGRELETDTPMRKSNHPVKTFNFSMSPASLWCFWKNKLPAALVWQRIKALGAALKTLKTVDRPW